MDHWLIVLQDGREQRFRLDRATSVLGQAADCDVRLSDPTVSRRHATLAREADGFVLEDLGSTNGSFVEQRRVQHARVAPGQLLRFGDLVARIEQRDAEDLALRVDLAAGGTDDVARSTQVGGASARFLLGELPRLLRAARAGDSAGAIARDAVAGLARAYPDFAIAIRRTTPGDALIAGADAIDADSATLDVPPFRFLWQRSSTPAELPAVLSLLGELLLLRDDDARAAPTAAAAPAPAPAPAIALPAPAPLDPRVVAIYRTATRIAPARDIHVLIEGESGTGKELLTRHLHAASGARGALVAINCAALPRDLLEAELFGIDRGVATGVDARAGRFEQADGGTLFLDEIGEMSPDVQAKLLRVLQEGQVQRLGSRGPRQVDVRIIAATNRDLSDLVERGTFRLDLYHRIADWSVRLPPLRERPADLANLAAHFLEAECRKRGLSAAGLGRDAMQLLRAYAWPGNVRELEREMRRAALFLENGQVLDPGHLSARVRDAVEGGGGRESAIEEGALREAIAATRGNMSAAAQRLGVARSTLYRRMKALGIPVNEA